MKYPKDITGLKFGRLTVLAKSDKLSKNRQTYWDCQCSCGNIKTIRRDALVSGITKSCSCIQKEHAKTVNQGTHRKTKTTEYKIWLGMKNRCYNQNYAEFHLYGGRGIKVCREWENSFPVFLADMGEKPSLDHSLDRIDNDANYNPANCRWATSKEQADNRRSNRLITFNDRTMTLQQWADELNMGLSTLKWRLKKWSSDRSIGTPVRYKKPYLPSNP